MLEAVRVAGSERTRSLRREWSRAFAVMLGLLLVAAIATIVGVRAVVGQVHATASQLHVESVTVAALRTALVDHEQVGHKLLSDKPVDRAAYVQQQHDLAVQFDRAVTIFPTTNGMRAIVLEARRSWQNGLTTYGLWGEQVQALHGNHSADNPTYGASSDGTASLLDGLEGPSLAAMDRGLAHGEDLERLLILSLVAMFGLALAVTAYFRRRMVTDLMRPVASMHQGVVSLQAGEYEYRIAVARRDELGALSEAFNTMAAALYDNHVALTLRATRDSLTGLPNRASLTERLTSTFGASRDRRAWQESVLFIDVDDFKLVNDTLGHDGGDALLMQLATRLNGCVRPHDLVARLGGDEFAVVVVEDDGAFTAALIAERIIGEMSEPFTVNGISLAVSVSIGVAQRRPETTDAAELLRCADFAMYMAKGGGKGRYQLYDAQLHDDMVDRSALKTDLAGATESGQLRLEYQPVADISTGEVLGVEALVRWQHPKLGLLPPAAFISLAEETGDIDAIGCWVLETATREVAGWRREMAHCADLWVSINLSLYQLPNAHSLAAIQRILADPATQADHVVLEITESAFAADMDASIAILRSLKRYGVHIAMDDFGTGFSSLGKLGVLPIDILKIDRTFVSGQASPSESVLEGILGLADKLSLTVIAEGIEQPDQLELLRTLGCTLGQGYLLARPAPPHTVEALLAAGGLLHVTEGPTRPVFAGHSSNLAKGPRGGQASTTGAHPTGTTDDLGLGD